MVSEDDTNKILVYLKKQGQTNTFRLARELGIDRYRILNIVKKLEEKGAVEFRSGIVKYLKFPIEEKKVAKKIIKKVPKQKKKVKHIARKISEKKAIAKYIKKLETRIKELEQKTNIPPKIVRRTVVKKVPVKSKKLKEQAERIEELEETIKELQKKVSAQPKIKTIIKKVPVELKKEPIKEGKEEIQPETQLGEEVSEKPEGAEITEEAPTEEVPEETVELKKEPIKEGKEEIKPKKSKLPKFDISLKNIQQLKRLEFIKLKTKIGKPKINFSELNKNIQQLHIPEIFKHFR